MSSPYSKSLTSCELSHESFTCFTTSAFTLYTYYIELSTGGHTVFLFLRFKCPYHLSFPRIYNTVQYNILTIWNTATGCLYLSWTFQGKQFFCIYARNRLLGSWISYNKKNEKSQKFWSFWKFAKKKIKQKIGVRALLLHPPIQSS